MSIDILNLAGGLCYLIGTYLMIASYQEFKENKTRSSVFMYSSAFVYILGATLSSIL